MADSKARIEQARERYKNVCEAEEKQREREREDLRFQVPELMWDDSARSQRKGDQHTPARPMLSISKLDQPRMLILNQMRSSDLGVNVHPISEDAEQETAEAIQGLYRHIERKSRAELTRYWAFDRAVTAGRGAYRVLTEYDDEGGDPSDQRIVIKRILHQDGVYFDPAAVEPDYRDGRFVFVVAWISKDEFARLYPDSKAAKTDKLSWESLGNEAPEWVDDDDVLVAEYWWKEITEEEFTAGNGEKRKREGVKVYCCKLSGWEELEEAKAWPGKYIPVIPVIGRELQPFDEERRFVGIIRPARDGQQLYNFAASTLVERMTLEPKAPFIVDMRSIEGFDSYWKQANTRNFAYLPFNGMVDGVAIPPPQRAQIDSSGMSIAMMALQEADQFIQASTSIFDPSLGRNSQKERSGKAIMASQQQADSATSHYLQNFADISMTYEADVILDLLPFVYDRQGRVTQIVRGDDGKAEPAMLGMPYTMDPEKKRPIPANAGQQGAKMIDLAKGRYAVSISIGKNFQTRLEHGAEFLTDLVSKMPALMPMIGDLVFQFRDDPGAREIAKRLSKIREKQFPGLGEGEDGAQPSPEQLKGQIEQMGQQMQGMQGQLKAAVQAIETEQAKQETARMKVQLDAQTAMQKAQLDSETKREIAAADNATKLEIANLGARVDEMLTLLKVQGKAYEIEAQAAHDDEQAAQSRLHEDATGERSRQHEAVMGEIGKPAPEKPEPPEPGEAE